MNAQFEQHLITRGKIANKGAKITLPNTLSFTHQKWSEEVIKPDIGNVANDTLGIQALPYTNQIQLIAKSAENAPEVVVIACAWTIPSAWHRKGIVRGSRHAEHR